MALLSSLPSSATLPLAGWITLRVEFLFFRHFDGGSKGWEADDGDSMATYVDHVL